MNLKTLLKGLAILLSIGFATLTWAQTAPSNLSGTALKDWIKINHFDNQHITLGYSTARMYMYNFIDNKNNKIEGVYSGYEKSWSYGGSGTNPLPINCEHTIPQSFFSSASPMRSDIHHLFPTYQNWNSARSNFRLGEIPDNQADSWMINAVSQTNIPSSNIDSYSEATSNRFEPRESHKGNTARAIFYFYTMYPTQAGDISQVADIDELYTWHLADPVDAAELNRNTAVASYQGNRNPYIDSPELVARAWDFETVPNDPNPDPDPPTTASTELIISEYVEGSSNNKAVEIANFTGGTVDLSAYELGKQANGAGSWVKDLPLSGYLQHGETFVVTHSSAQNTLKNLADLTSSNGTISFNGNDPVALFKNGTLIDMVGTQNAGSSYFGKDVTLVRKSNITNPNTTYDENEWEVFANNTYIYLGTHEMDAPVTPDPPAPAATDLFFSEYVEGSSYNKTIEIANTTDADVDLSIYSVKKQANGAGNWSGGISLSGYLAAGDVFVLSHSSADAALLAEADYASAGSELSFNGNDAIGLFKDGVLLDIIGDFNGGSAYFAKDVTLVRNADILSPNATYTVGEWTSFGSNTFSGIGSHNGPAARMVKEELVIAIDFQVYPNPIRDQANIQFYLESDASVRLSLFDLSGRELMRISESNLLAGEHHFSIASGDLQAGIYFLSLEMGNVREIFKLIKLD